MEAQLNKAFEESSKAISELAQAINSFTKSQPIEDLVELFSNHNVMDLHESFKYYQEREMYKCCEAINRVVDNNIKLLVK